MRFIMALMTSNGSAHRRDSVLARAVQSLRRLPQLIRDGWREDLIALRNLWRRQRGARVDYVVMRLSGALPERSGPPRSFLQRQLPLPPRPLTIEALNYRFQRIAEAGNVRGVVLILGDFTFTGLARIQNVRRSIARLREAGKEVIVYTPYLDLAHYYLACAADKVLAPPGAQFDVVGLHSEAIFLRNALQRVGIEAEVLQISPYKTAGNVLSRSDISPEQRQQMEWLIEDTYNAVTADMAKSRALAVDEIKSLIDAAPFTAERAAQAGLLNMLAYEDQIPDILADDGTYVNKTSSSRVERASEKKVTILTWHEARPLLMEKVRRSRRRYIGVISLDGVIIMGQSRQPPVNLPIPLVGGAMSGEETLIQQLRRAQRDKDMAGLILHVESGGGSSLASELIWRQVMQLAEKKPVLAYMGDVAASGGYFVSAGAQYIMSQRSTLTGSIGVLLTRMNPGDLFNKLAINHASVKRGAHAGLYTEPRALQPEERELLWVLIRETYGQFRTVVRQARDLDEEQLEGIAGGRVWTGRQARQHGLVDSHGDFVDAVHKIAAMAGLTDDPDKDEIRVRNLFARSGDYLPPQSNSNSLDLADLIPLQRLRTLNGQPLLLIPFDLRFF